MSTGKHKGPAPKKVARKKAAAPAAAPAPVHTDPVISKIPHTVKRDSLNFIAHNDIPADDRALLLQFAGFAYTGPTYTRNVEQLWPVAFVEQFYSLFVPFYQTVNPS